MHTKNTSCDKQLCALCGERKATTREHVPPKGIFARPRPQLITVPACEECNLGSSVVDESFRTYLGLHATITPGAGASLFQESLRSLQHNRALYREVLSNAQRAPFFTPAGGFAGEGLKILWNSESHDAVLEKSVRGLYFHHFGSILGKSTNVKVQWLRGVPSSLEEFLLQCPIEVIGDNQVLYRYGRSAENRSLSIWLFNFYGSHLASGYSSSPVEDIV